MIDRKCTYKWYVEEQGNKKDIVCTGIVRTNPATKSTGKGDITVVWIEDDKTGEMREVALYAVSFPKGGANA